MFFLSKSGLNPPLLALLVDLRYSISIFVCRLVVTKNIAPPGYAPAGFENADGEITYGRWRPEIPVTSSGNSNSGQFQVLLQLRGHRWSNEAVEMRNYLKDYMNSEEESLSWQPSYVRRAK